MSAAASTAKSPGNAGIRVVALIATSLVCAAWVYTMPLLGLPAAVAGCLYWCVRIVRTAPSRRTDHDLPVQTLRSSSRQGVADFCVILALQLPFLTWLVVRGFEGNGLVVVVALACPLVAWMGYRSSSSPRSDRPA